MRNFAWLILLLCNSVQAATPLVIYDDALRSGFNDHSWAQPLDYNLANASPTFGGSSKSIRFIARNWGGLQFVADGTEFNVADYQSLTFQLNGGSAGGQKLQFYLCDNYDVSISDTLAVDALITGGAIPANSWATVTLDFDTAQMTYGTFNCFVLMDADGNNDAAGQAAVYVDQIVLNPRVTAIANGGSVAVNVDLNANTRALNAQIFGVASGDPVRNGQMGYTVDRWGGNSVTRYNWQANFYNTANDYFFENIPNCNSNYCPPGVPKADLFIAAAFGANAQPLITIPTIGLTPRPDSAVNHPYTVGFAVSKYGAQQSIDQYDTNAGNGNHTNGTPIVGNDPNDSTVAAPPAFEQQWVAHLQSTFGTAANGGVKLYALDNEVMLWNSTHRDVHPTAPTYDEIWSKTVSYATAIKQQEPDALITGPVTWGYPDLWTSAADAASCNCLDGSDREAANHGGKPFVAWYLQQVCANPLAGGKHLTDYLDLHYYPQGNKVSLNSSDEPTTATLRLRSLKELYDATWISESWIGTLDGAANDDPTWHYTKPDLIPRVRAWIDAYCPGTKLAITEYNWGNDGTTSGAVAQAEVLAIFAREGVDMATRWVAPGSNTRAERAFQIFLNYDAAGGKVQGDSVKATSANIDQIGAYAFRLFGQRTMLLLTNKDTLNHDVALTFATPQSGTWKLYGFDATHALHSISSGSISGTTLTLTGLTPISASLLVLPDNDGIFRNGFE